MTPFEPRVRLLALLLALGSCQSAPEDALPDGSAEPGAAALPLGGRSAAGTGKVIYGPQSFGPGLHFRFFRVAGPIGSSTLSVVNGDLQTGQSRVAGALITLNGQTVVGTRDLTTKVASVEKSVTLHKVNLLSLLVIGRRGSFITVSIAPQTNDTPPVASAGADQTIPYPYLGQRVVLDGSASSDIDGDLLTYRWDLISRPAGSVAALEDPTAVRPAFVIDQSGDYVARLVVNDGTTDSAPDTVTVSTANSAPVANAGPDQKTHVNAAVTLDASGSSDVDGDQLTYAWSLTARPAGSSAQLSDRTAVKPTFIADQPGMYLAQLVVNDGLIDSAPDEVVITTENSPPVANAGPDQSALVTGRVALDGSASSDVDGDPLTYRWSFTAKPAGSVAVLSDPSSARPAFVVDRPGAYVAQLIVNDGRADSLPDTVVVTTQNSPPVANAGADQSVLVGTAVTLDGSRSADVDGDPLTYQWSLLSAPVGSGATLADPTAARTGFTVDRSGTYVAQLIVSDGTAASAPASTTITTQNSRPVANAGPDQAAVVGQTVALDGSASSDADGDPLTFAWSLLSRPSGSTASLEDPTAVSPRLVPDVVGDYIAQLIVSDAALSSAPATTSITVPNRPPVISNPGTALNATEGVDFKVQILASDPDGQGLTYGLTAAPTGMTLDATGLVDWPAPLVGTITFTVQVTDTLGAGASQTFTVQTAPALVVVPLLVGQGRNAALAALESLGLQAGAITESPSDSVPAGKISGQAPPAGTQVAAGAKVDMVQSTGPAGGGGLPADPIDVAPPNDPVVATTTYAGSQFLYSGANPIQTGVAAATITPDSVAVIRGRVFDRQNDPLPGVAIAILDHPELGRTTSRADGMFDLAVNGGGPLTVTYAMGGFLPAHRQIDAPWRDYIIAPDVALTPLDNQVATVDLTSAVPMQVVRGTRQTDADGSRQATVLFPQGTQAQMMMPDGTTEPLTSLQVRATEFTVGNDGPQAMPAQLPPTSGYTYAVELTVDQALAAGAQSVTFDQPVPFYVENFIGFPVGIDVPLGSYDRTRGAWVPSDSGRVLKIVSVTLGLADLDVTGDGAADSGGVLTALGITDAERQQLAVLYSTGTSLWRVRIPHFTAWDLNWTTGVPPGARAPGKDPSTAGLLDGGCLLSGRSVIECQNQVLGEAVHVTGTDFDLHYQSERVPGYTAGNGVDIPLSGDTLPPGVRSMEVEVRVGGRMFTQHFAPAPNQSTTFAWDGRDAYGRPLFGAQPIAIRTGYTYQTTYGRTGRFSDTNPDGISLAPARQEVTLWHPWFGVVGTWDARAAGLGGWTLSAQHAYDPRRQVLYRGDGKRESSRALGPTISTVQTQGAIDPQGLAIVADGTLYVANGLGFNVRRLAPDGTLTTVAGNGSRCTSATSPAGDGGPALQASVVAGAVAVGSDRSLFVADGCTGRIRKVDAHGTITTIAGTGVIGYSGDGGPGYLAQIATQSEGIAVGPDDSLYIADTLNFRIRRVGTDGIITTVAGNGSSCSFTPTAPCGDGGPATRATLGVPNGVAVGRDGSLYIADGGTVRIRKVTPDGVIHTIAGTGTAGNTGDGGPATSATFRNPFAVAVGTDDSVYIVDRNDNRVRWLRPDGFINTLAGNGVSGTSGDGGPPTLAQLQDLANGLVVGPDGSVYVSQTANTPRIRKIAPAAERFVAGELVVPSVNGREVYLFTPGGQHLKTIDAVTGALRYQFAYDGAGSLASVTDGYGKVTGVERDTAGNPTAIAGPFGQRTTLAINPDGYLDHLTTPAAETASLVYTAGGLLTGYTKPGGQRSSYAYDALGRIVGETDPAGAQETFTRSGTNEDYTVAMTSALGRTTTYTVEQLATGDQRLTETDPTGVQTVAVLGQSGSQSITYPNGNAVNAVLAPDPRWGMRAPLLASTTVRTPGGRTLTLTSQRAVALANVGDLLNLKTLTDTMTFNGRSFTSSYDAPTRTLLRTTPAGRQASTVVDGHGRPVQAQSGGLAPSSYVYDAQGRLASATRGTPGDNRTTTFAYGLDGFLSGTTDALDRSLAFTNDQDGRILTQTFPDGGQARFTYDANGNRTSLSPPGQSAHGFGYTERDQLSEYNEPLVGSSHNRTTYTYDPDRLVARVDRPDGRSLSFQYDGAGRLTMADLSSDQRTYSYDAAGRFSTLSTSKGLALAYAYDGDLLSGATWSGPVAGSVTRTYDDDFRISSYSVNGGNPVAIQYDADGLPVQVGALHLTRSAQTGFITGTTLGTVSGATTYDAFGAVASSTASLNGSAIYTAVYARDPLERIRQKTETIGGATHVSTYAYDPVGRLTEVRVDGALAAGYAYDANGNRLSRTGAGEPIGAAYDAQDRLIQYGSATYTYSDSGERLSKGAGGQATSYGYDGLGNLTTLMLPDGTLIEYLLDAQGRRVGRAVNGIVTQGFLYQDGLRPIAELDIVGNVSSRFVYYGRVGAPAYVMRGGATYRIITDQLGSPRLVIDVATGVVAQRMDFDEFGNVLLDTNPGFQPFGFGGGLYDRDAGLSHFGAREYEAETGRWITKDPLGFGGGDDNLYAYVGSAPVDNVDREGLCTDTLQCTCLRQPALCEALAGGGAAGAAGQQVLQHGGEIAETAAPAIEACPALEVGLPQLTEANIHVWNNAMNALTSGLSPAGAEPLYELGEFSPEVVPNLMDDLIEAGYSEDNIQAVADWVDANGGSIVEALQGIFRGYSRYGGRGRPSGR